MAELEEGLQPHILGVASYCGLVHIDSIGNCMVQEVENWSA